MDSTRRKARAASISVVSNSALVVAKLVIGLLTGSVSVISEAIHSGIDLIAAGIALFAVKQATKPADEEHRYGHGKIENLSGTVEAMLIFLAAIWIVYEAVHRLIARTPVEMAGLGAAVMAGSAIANFLVSRMLFRVGKATDSIALQADAWHLRTDVWTSVGVMAGLVALVLAQRFFPAWDLWWLDPVVAIGVALLIVKAAFDLARQSLRDVMDQSLPADEERWIVDHVQTVPGLCGFHGLRTRKAGSQRFVDFHMLVDRDLSVEAAHRLSHDVSDAIERHFGGASVTIHIEPCDGRCSPTCLAGCMLDPQRQAAVRDRRAAP
ncbi:MAG: cation transporter [Deltaproteobacteria bacterium]|nr:cation transporter [Deltaproteobacteria bacterium]